MFLIIFQSFNFSKTSVEENKPNVIGRLKRKRYGCTKCLTFDSPEIPTLPKNIPTGGICSAKIVTSETLEQLKSVIISLNNFYINFLHNKQRF